ncbi:universal stress protein [Chloroflexus sp. Y-396-1]|uniref:universal stress protein n=1 Tax=Chloroflexus sp. Y-396-1 TaxID=867845 RepID=UPI00048FA537|nr:universal stress protein [Chloroflexus sp. Y-396-1]
MHIALYAGEGLQADDLLTFAKPFITTLARQLTLIAPTEEQSTLDEILTRLQLDPTITVRRWCQEESFTLAILKAVQTVHPDVLLLPAFTARATPLEWWLRREEFNLLRMLPVSFLRVHGRITPIRQILLASAGGEQSIRCVPLVSQIARAFQATVTVLHVVSQEVVYFEGFAASPLSGETALQIDEATATVLHRMVAALATEGVSCRLQVINGLVEETLLTECQHYDLFVIGSHLADDVEPTSQWLRFLRRISLQDVTRDLLEGSPIPVLVVR